jgi:transposase
MQASSNDLRRALIAAYDNHPSSQRAVAALFGVSPATVRTLVRRKRATGTPDALPRAGGKRTTMGPPIQDRVRQLVAKRNDRTLAELCAHIAQEYHTRGRVATMCRRLQRLGLRRKKSRSTRRNGTPHAARRHA